MPSGRCACGDATVSVARRPDYINCCNCRLCQRTGGAWGYFQRGEVTIDGETQGFVREDLPEACLTTLFCPRCGSTLAWVSLDPDYTRMGVNMRLFDPEHLRGIETRFPDGQNWDEDTDYTMRHDPMPYGEGPIF